MKPITMGAENPDTAEMQLSQINAKPEMSQMETFAVNDSQAISDNIAFQGGDVEDGKKRQTMNAENISNGSGSAIEQATNIRTRGVQGESASSKIQYTDLKNADEYEGQVL